MLLAGLSILGAILVVTVGMLAIKGVNDVSRGTTRAQTVLQPAASAADSLELAVANMERGVAAFALGGFESDLRPYLQGQRRSTLELADLNLLLGDDPRVRRLIEIVEGNRSEWIAAIGDPAAAAMRRGDRRAAKELITGDRNLVLFGRLIDNSNRVRDAIDQIRNAEAARLEAEARRLLRLTAFGAGVLIGAVLLSAALLFRWVLAPLQDLRAQMRSAAARRHLPGGIQVTGPKEIRAVGEDAEHMRRQLNDQIDRAVRATDLARRAEQSLARDAPVVSAIQSELTARTDPDLPGVWVHGEVQPAETVLAGDFWDTVAAPDGKAALVITDVAGHGPAVGVSAVRLKHLLAMAIASGRSPGSALALANRRLVDENEPVATAAIVVVDPADGTVTWANAGHHPPLLVSAAGSAVELSNTGPLLSWLGGPWRVETGRMAPDDMLVLFSDGLVESHDQEGEQLGVAGLLELLHRARSGGNTGRDLVRRTMALARERAVDWERDDVTMVVLTLADRSAAQAAESVGGR